MARPNLGKLVASKLKPSKQGTPSRTNAPAVTRFAPSPTGVIHLGSLRTALYNYLLAKSTAGKFILRLEDTDQTRLKPGAEANIYESLRWSKINWDEGPIRQSERKILYAKFADQLLRNGQAYRCFCSKDRLDQLTQSARKLWPPTTASYDRKCSHISAQESDQRAASGESFVIRFKSPQKWPKFSDVLHGDVEINTQINEADRRYDDFVLLKSDKMPTYHFANVVDDYEMQITHVVRGEEWLPSTPKHIALYRALGVPEAQVPSFVHIPLLTSAGGKKLSKRKGDHGVLELAKAPEYVLPEALVNFVALLGWSPLAKGSHHQHTPQHGESVSEVLSLSELEQKFSLQGLTKGNVQVDYSKLAFLNKQHFQRLLKSDFSKAAGRCQSALNFEMSLASVENALRALKDHVSSIGDFVNFVETTRAEPAHPYDVVKGAINGAAMPVLVRAQELCASKSWEPEIFMTTLLNEFKKKRANMAMRYALLDGKSGVSIVESLILLGPSESLKRITHCIDRINFYITAIEDAKNKGVSASNVDSK